MNNKRRIGDISYQEKFWYGTIFRMYNAGMNPDIVEAENNYYDYMLTLLPWESNHLALVNVTENNFKKGHAYGGLIPIHNSGDKFVTRAELEIYLGPNLSDWFLIE
jgi:hypothetical protein